MRCPSRESSGVVWLQTLACKCGASGAGVLRAPVRRACTTSASRDGGVEARPQRRAKGVSTLTRPWKGSAYLTRSRLPPDV
eukprot:scaffold19666_cov65-Phaeocystis_antarctica.AAC.3